MKQLAHLGCLLAVALLSGCFNSHGQYHEDAGSRPDAASDVIPPDSHGSGGITGSSTGGTVGGGGKDGGTDSVPAGTGGPVLGGGGASGGVTASGGSTGSAGSTATGGNPGSGGFVATGGAAAIGGGMANGGTASGGRIGTGGAAAVGGKPGTGGTTASGGATAVGGSTATGGRVGSGGTPGTGGVAPVCQGTSTQCLNAQMQTCVNGQWGTASDCPSRQACTGASGSAKCTCIADPVCTAATNVCATSSSLTTCARDANGCFYQSGSMACGTNRTCTGSSCMCTAGTTDCGASGCINVTGTDTQHCGSCTKACSTGQSCTSGSCTCTNGAAACGGCLAWDFEWGTNPSPWSLATTPGISGNGATNIAISKSQVHGGASALIAPVLVDTVTTHIAEVTVSLPCKVDLAGFSGSLYMYFAGGMPLTDFGNQLIVDTWDSSSSTAGDHNVPFFGNIPTNGWFKVTLGFTSSTQVDRIGIYLSPASNWTGTLYVDDVVINGL